MKTNKLFILCSALSLVLAFSCNVFTGSDFKGSEPVKFEHELSDDVKAYNVKTQTIKATEIEIITNAQDSYGEYIIQRASKDTVISVKISGYTCADPATFEQAVKFYPLTADNEALSAYYPVRGEALTAKLKTSKTEGTVVTGVFVVDTSEVTTDYIEIIVYANALKDKNGELMLNNDGNTVPGEETDNCVYYLEVTHDVDNNIIDGAINWENYNSHEDFCPPLANNLQKLFDFGSTNWQINLDEGKIIAESVEMSYAATGSVPAGYYSGYADTLNNYISLEYLAPDATAWKKDTAFVFTYTADNTYKATGSVLPQGSQYHFVYYPVEVVEETIAPVIYGHPIKKKLKNEVSYQILILSTGMISIGGSQVSITVDYYGESPDYIVNDRTTAFAAGDFASWDIQDAQKDFLTVTSKGNGKFIVTLDENYEFESWSDFIVTDCYAVYNSNTSSYVAEQYGTKLPATVTQNADNKNQIIIQLKNKYFAKANTLIWVGSGVSIRENLVNESQKKFGIYKDPNKKDASGYVNIWANYSPLSLAGGFLY